MKERLAILLMTISLLSLVASTKIHYYFFYIAFISLFSGICLIIYITYHKETSRNRRKDDK